MDKHCKIILATIGTIVLSLQLLSCRSSAPQPSNRQLVWAQMFIKGDIQEKGFFECNAEGKRYGIKPVRQQTFYLGEKSFNMMHHHGVALESEQMAYRIYFDNRHTIDVYAKRTPRLELARSLWYPNDEQLAEHFGDDVLKVGNTIGVGTVRPYDAQKQKLTAMDKFVSRTQRIVSLNQKKAVAEVVVQGLQIEDTIVDLTTRYTILAGHRDMKCEVFCNVPLHTLVTGVQKIGSGPSITENDADACLLASWGTDWPVNDTIKYAKETVGLAVTIQKQYVTECLSDDKQRLAGIKLDEKGYAKFYLTVVAQKEEQPQATDFDTFLNYVRSWKPQY